MYFLGLRELCEGTADFVVLYLKDTLLEHELQIATLKTLSNIGKADWQKELSQWEQQNELQDHDYASFLLSSVHPFIEAILNNLPERFPTWDIDILSSGEMFNPRNLPSTPAECYLYGRDWKEAVLTLQGKNNTREVLLFIVSHSSLYPYHTWLNYLLLL